jgi:hypothetical protein
MWMTKPGSGRRRAAPRWVASLLPALAVSGCYSGLQMDEGAAAGDSASDTAADTAGGPDGSGPGGGDAEPPALCNGEPGVAPRPMLRLTPTEYENTMRDLLGDPQFVTDYDALEPVVTERAVRQLRNGAEAALERRDAWTAPVFPCDLGGSADDACVESFLDDFAPRAFRRPLKSGERQWLRSVYDEASSTMDFAGAMEVLAQTVLQSPGFVYLDFEGIPVEGAPDEIRLLSDYEVANRLSYFLWDTMPDDALFDAAAEGKLVTKAGLAEQVDRMLDDPRSQAKVQDLVWQWVELDGGTLHFSLEESAKNPELFPEYDPGLQAAMRTEFEALVSDTFSEQGGSFDTLLTSRRAFVNRSLADLYGVQGGPVDDDDWQWVELDPTQRSGLLTRAAFLAVYAGPNVHSPIRRGVSVIKDVLCTSLADPPPDANDVPPEGGDDDEIMTVREQVDARTMVDGCAACHQLINPVGFSFENYDAIGRWQDNEVVSGLPVDSSGAIHTSDVDGPVDDAIALSERLITSAQVKECFADSWFQQAIGGELGELDDCERERILQEFSASGDMRALVKEVVLSDTFRFINTSAQEQ